MASTISVSETTTARGAIDERKLLVECVRRSLRPENQPIPSLPSDVNWERLIQLARDHQVVTLLNKSLRGASGVPVPVQRWMEGYCRTIVSHNLSLLSELTELLEALEESGVQAVPFKGPIWAKILYGNLADRQIRDVDLFIGREDISRAATVLVSRGYLEAPPPSAIPAGECKDIGFIHPATGISVELHWSACESWRNAHLSRLHLWSPESTTDVRGRQVPLPSAEHMFILLAIHGYRHGWESLQWLCDIAMFLQKFPQLDFENLLEEAKRISCRRLVLVPLALTHGIFRVSLPTPVADAIAREPIIAEIAAQIERRYFTAEADRWASEIRRVSGRMYQEWFCLQMCDGFWNRLAWHSRLLVGVMRPNDSDRTWFRGKLPEPVYWFLKPLRLLRSYGLRNFLRLVRKFVDRSTPYCKAMGKANRL